jgi:hypothetical protein
MPPTDLLTATISYNHSTLENRPFYSPYTFVILLILPGLLSPVPGTPSPCIRTSLLPNDLLFYPEKNIVTSSETSVYIYQAA